MSKFFWSFLNRDLTIFQTQQLLRLGSCDIVDGRSRCDSGLFLERDTISIVHSRLRSPTHLDNSYRLFGQLCRSYVRRKTVQQEN